MFLENDLFYEENKTCKLKRGGGGGGDSHIKVTGVIVRGFRVLKFKMTSVSD